MVRKGLGKDKTMEVKKLAIVFSLVLLLCPVIKAQELTVKSFREAGYDLAARTQVRKDINGYYCALLKVQLVASRAQFDGNVIGEVVFKNNEYWVYMSQGSKRLKVYHPNYLPLEVTFSDYGIDHLESKCTYVLTLLRSDVQQGNLRNLQVVSERSHTNYEEKRTENNPSHSSDNSKVYDVVEEMPQFPGGPSALFEYLSKNIRYPVEAEKKGVQGRVIVTFVVERDGSIIDVKVVKSVDPSLDMEAKRVVSSMPHWIPGKQNGSAVRVKYTVPVTFKLPEIEERMAEAESHVSAESRSHNGWFVFGTQHELEEQGILSDNRIDANLSQHKDYFTKIDIRIDKTIKLYSSNAEILTNHPRSSYTLTLDAKKQYVLRISDPYLFWSRSKYLVIRVK